MSDPSGPPRHQLPDKLIIMRFLSSRPAGDLGMVAPRMLGPEVRRCYEEGSGFITAVGVQHDATGYLSTHHWERVQTRAQ